MMYLERLKTDCLFYRKKRSESPAYGIKADLLTTLIGEIEMIGKNAQRDVTDQDCIATIKKFLKGVQQSLDVVEGVATKLLCDHQSLDAVQGVATKLLCEEATLLDYLPKQLETNELRVVIAIDIIKENGYNSIKDMGKVMKDLKEKHDGTYDGKLASILVKEILNEL